MECHHRLQEQDPDFRRRLIELEHDCTERMAARQPLRVGITTIPVVVHVVYRTRRENITTAQVQSQINAQNRDFRAQNADRSRVPAVWSNLVTDTRIQFALATTDPLGNATSGITRTRTTRLSFTTDDSVKSRATGGANPWPTDRYQNIWVCTLAGGLLGYVQFPGGPMETDGVVVLNTSFGTRGTAQAPFNLGRTAVHEIGHWLNLHHIWGDGFPRCLDSDYVSDTPHWTAPAPASGPAYDGARPPRGRHCASSAAKPPLATRLRGRHLNRNGIPPGHLQVSAVSGPEGFRAEARWGAGGYRYRAGRSSS